MNVSFQNCRSAAGLQSAAQNQAAYLKSLAHLKPEAHSPEVTRLDIFEKDSHVQASFQTTPAWESKNRPDFTGRYLVERPDGTATACRLNTDAYGSTVEEYTRWADGTIEAFQYTNKNGKFEAQELSKQGSSLVETQKWNSYMWGTFQNLSKLPAGPGLIML